MNSYEELRNELENKLWEHFPRTREEEGADWGATLLEELEVEESKGDEESYYETKLTELLEDARETALITQYEKGYREASGMEELDTGITLMAHDWAQELWKQDNERWKALTEEEAYSEGSERAKGESSFQE